MPQGTVSRPTSPSAQGTAPRPGAPAPASKPPAAAAPPAKRTPPAAEGKVDKETRHEINLGKETFSGMQRLPSVVTGEAPTTITIATCPHCHAKLKLAQPVAVGRTIKCANCGQNFAALPDAPAAAAPPPPKPAPASPEAPAEEAKATGKLDAPSFAELLEKETKGAPAPAKAPTEQEKARRARLWWIRGGAIAGLVLLLGVVIAAVSSSRTNPLPTKSTYWGRPIPTTEQEPIFTIRLKSFPAVGASVDRREVNEQSGVVRYLEPGGKVIREEKMARSNEVEFVEVILEGGEPQPRRFKRTYRKAQDTSGGASRSLSYEGRTIVFELTGEQYQASAVGEPALSPADLADLARRITRHDQAEAILPRKSVKIGETWPIDLAKFARMLAEGAEVDNAASTGEARLSKVMQRDDGQMFGVILIELKMSVKSMKGMRFYPPAVFELTGTLETPIDGSSTQGVLSTRGKLSGSTVVDRGGQKIVLEMAMETSGKQERTGEK
jgi:hypothetical protein